MDRQKREAAWRTVVVLGAAILLVGGGSNLAAAQAINVDGEFSGTLGGYNDGDTDQPHIITIEGTFTISGENAQNVQVMVSPGQQTVLEQSSVETFVEGDRDVSFDRINRGNQAALQTDEIPSGTTIQINFEVVYVGGTTTNEVDAGSVTISYETAGGTEGEESFGAPTDMTASADNRISSLQSEISGMQNWRLVGIAGGLFGALGIISTVVLYRKLKKEKEKNKTGPIGPTGPDP
jgi:hypothetical protein